MQDFNYNIDLLNVLLMYTIQNINIGNKDYLHICLFSFF